MDPDLLTSVSDEFRSVNLGDKRLNKRLKEIATATENSPGASLPEQARTSAALEGSYRFFCNKRVSAEDIFSGHVAATLKRIQSEERILVIHDTTDFRFGGIKPREGLGRLTSKKNEGFLAHFSFCVASNGKPLGCLGLYAWARHQEKRKKKLCHSVALRNGDRESLRWHDTALAVGELLGQETNAIHLMDREGDSYELFCLLVEHEQRFIIRLGHDRRLEKGRGRSDTPKLFEALCGAPLFFEREVHLAARTTDSKTRGKGYPARATRTARFEVRAATHEIFANHTALAHLPQSVTLQCVEAREVDAPKGEEPVVWRLVTTEPIETEEDIATIIDAYRRRWIVEEFFKALKTGCRYQSLQLESARGLMIALVIESVVAWRMLLIRWLAHSQSNGPASNALTPQQLAVLTALARTQQHKALSDPITVQQALFEIASLGGHIKNNGPPGWLTLRRGFEKLNALQQGWELFAKSKLEM